LDIAEGQGLGRICVQRSTVAVGAQKRESALPQSSGPLMSFLNGLHRESNFLAANRVSYLAQLESERRVKDGEKWRWERIQKMPNNLWDCEAMATVLAFMLKILGREADAGDSTEQESADAVS
jgi:hypothetical protein